jgi:transposase
MGQFPKQIIKRYSLAFKQQVVKEYEAGTSASALRRRYGISNTHMVVQWVEKYGREGVRHKLMVVQTPEEQERVKELEARIAELENLTAQLALDKFMLECSLTVAEKELGHKVKKKSPTSSSVKQKSGSKKSKAR